MSGGVWYSFTYCRLDCCSTQRAPTNLMSQCQRWPWRTEEAFQWKWFHSKPAGDNKRNWDYSWPKQAISQSSIHPLTQAFAAVTYIGVICHGLSANSKTVIELGHGVVWVLELVLLPQALLLQEFPGCLTPLQRDPRIHQLEQLISYPCSYSCMPYFLVMCRPFWTSHYLYIGKTIHGPAAFTWN